MSDPEPTPRPRSLWATDTSWERFTVLAGLLGLALGVWLAWSTDGTVGIIVGYGGVGAFTAGIGQTIGAVHRRRRGADL